MIWDVAATQVGRFLSARRCLRAMFPRRRAPGKTYQGFIKRLLKLNAVLPAVQQHLRQAIRHACGDCWMREGHLAFAVDGSRIECPRTIANEKQFGHAGKKGCGPQMWLTTLWHMGSGLPWAWKQGPAADSERMHVRELLPLLPPASLLVADAGFAGFDLLNMILDAGHSFLFRVGGNVRLLTQLGRVELHGEDTVWLWPQGRRKEQPLVLRLVVLRREGRCVYLITNLSEDRLGHRQAAALYGMRWGVEVFYRSLKQTLEHRVMRSRAPAQAQAELAWSLVGLQLMGLMSVSEMIQRRIEPLRWSPAATRDLLRKAIAGHCHRRLSTRGWGNRLAACIKDDYVRRRSKKARQWPDRKHDHPPGPPKIQPASSKELRQLQRLLAAKPAA